MHCIVSPATLVALRCQGHAMTIACNLLVRLTTLVHAEAPYAFDHLTRFSRHLRSCRVTQCMLFLVHVLQERYLEQLMAGPFLSPEEHDIIRWGGNAKITIPKRFSQSGKHAQTYRAATSIECLVSLQWRCLILPCMPAPYIYPN